MNLYLTTKRSVSRPLVLFVSGFMAALAVFCYFWENAAFWLAFASLALAVACVFLRKHIPIARLLAVLFAGICFGGCAWSACQVLVYRPALSLADAGGSFTGYIQSYPTFYGDYTRLEWKLASKDGEAIRAVKVCLYLDGDYSHLQPGDAIRVETTLEIPENTWRFNMRRYLNSHAVYLKASAPSAELLSDVRIPFTARLQRIARQIDRKLNEIMPARQAALMTALLFGDETGLEDGFAKDLRLTGLSHITAVSGMNVAFLVCIVLALLGRRTGSITAIPVVLVFMFMTGAPASVVRASIMQIMWLLSFFLVREPDSLTSLFVSAAFILLGNPFAIADLGFLLSFFATLGILVYGSSFYAVIKRRIRVKNKLLARALSGMAGILATTLSAQVFILPVQVLFFNEISLISPLSNLFVLWAAEYAFTFGVAAALAAMLWLPLGIVLGWLPRLLCSFILWSVSILADIPFAAVSARNAYAVVLLLFAYLLLALLHLSKRSHALLAAICMAGMCVLVFTLSAISKQTTASLAVVSTGTGQSVVLCQGSACVVWNCGGSSEYAASGIDAFLWENGRKKIDMLFVSSYRRADYANVYWMLKNYQVDVLYLPEPGNEKDLRTYIQLCETALSSDTETGILVENAQFLLEEMDLEIYVNHSDDADDGRLLFFARVAGQKLLAPGAIQAENLGRMLSEIQPGSVDILALGDYYSTRALPGSITMLKPKYAVASAYDETGTDLIYALSRAGTQVITTQRQGSFTVRIPYLYKIHE